MMTFVEYCEEKSIDASAFEKGEKSLFDNLQSYFNQVHPNSFTAQKLFIINDIRRRFHFEKPKIEKKKARVSNPKMAIPGAKKVVGKVPVAKPKITVGEKLDVSEEKLSLKPKIPVSAKVKPVMKTKVSQLKIEKSSENKPSAKILKPKIGKVKKDDTKVEIKKPVLKPKIPTKKKE